MMGKLEDFLSGTKILEEAKSPINGKITVVKSIAFGTYIQVNDLTQSGGVVYDVWKTVLKKVQGSKSQIQNCLILGLGGGSAAKLVSKYYPDAKITGIDIDPLMVEMGKKYLNLDKINVDIKIQDAYKFLTTSYKLSATSYDLILVDTYLGDKFPTKLESETFLRLVQKILSPSGITVFNRLYYGEKRPEAMRFLDKLEKIFSYVEPIYPEANIMFVCKQ